MTCRSDDYVMEWTIRRVTQPINIELLIWRNYGKSYEYPCRRWRIGCAVFFVPVRSVLSYFVKVKLNGTTPFLELCPNRGQELTVANELQRGSKSCTRTSDLLPINCTVHFPNKYINPENDGYENKQIHRGADHWLSAPGRGRYADQGDWAQTRLQ